MSKQLSEEEKKKVAEEKAEAKKQAKIDADLKKEADAKSKADAEAEKKESKEKEEADKKAQAESEKVAKENKSEITGHTGGFAVLPCGKGTVRMFNELGKAVGPVTKVTDSKAVSTERRKASRFEVQRLKGLKLGEK